MFGLVKVGLTRLLVNLLDSMSCMLMVHVKMA